MVHGHKTSPDACLLLPRKQLWPRCIGCSGRPLTSTYGGTLGDHAQGCSVANNANSSRAAIMCTWDRVFWSGYPGRLCKPNIGGQFESGDDVTHSLKTAPHSPVDPPYAGMYTPKTPTTREAMDNQPRAVRFNPCVQVTLIPSCRDFDDATLRQLWWARADISRFRSAASFFFKVYGRRNDVVAEEMLPELERRLGMPSLPTATAPSGGVTVSPPAAADTRQSQQQRALGGADNVAISSEDWNQPGLRGLGKTRCGTTESKQSGGKGKRSAERFVKDRVATTMTPSDGLQKQDGRNSQVLFGVGRSRYGGDPGQPGRNGMLSLYRKIAKAESKKAGVEQNGWRYPQSKSQTPAAPATGNGNVSSVAANMENANNYGPGDLDLNAATRCAVETSLGKDSGCMRTESGPGQDQRTADTRLVLSKIMFAARGKLASARKFLYMSTDRAFLWRPVPAAH